MKLLPSLLLALSLFSGASFAQEPVATDSSTKHEYQSDVARLRKIVIESLYSHREVFLRELISNANDAIEKLRLTALKDKTVWDGVAPLNITLKLEKNEEGDGGRLIISDTGIGMSPKELTTNLGTLAKSGTSEFLAKADSNSGSSNGNLIGAFGLGFYSSFLVADKVYVASLPPATEANPQPVQHVFSSSADEPSFDVYPDPRGNTLGRGTEITLVLKKDALEYLEEETVKSLITKHSGFASSFPVYLFTKRIEEQPIPQDELDQTTEEKKEKPKVDDDEVVVEDAKEEEPKENEVKTRQVTVEEWVHLNDQPPLWTRDPKDVTDEEYKNFYKATFKQYQDPILWHHFKGDSGPVSFRALIYVPSTLPEDFWQSPQTAQQDTRLLVKRVLITSEFGEHRLPKWISWAKVIIDADDLPLNVSRETLQSNRFLKQIKNIIITRFIQVMQKTAEEDVEKYKEILKVYNPILKLGVIETAAEGKTGNRDKLSSLLRFDTTLRTGISLQDYVDNRKEGQNQIFFLANIGQTTENMRHSVFVEKLIARGYEVLLMTDTMDEIFVSNLRVWGNMRFQDVAKKGLQYGDEDVEKEKKELEKFKEDYKPLVNFFVKSTKDISRMAIVISNRLVTSPCAIVVDSFGYSANMEKLLTSHGKKTALQEYASKQKVLEINPRSPLIEGLLKRVMALPVEETERDKEEEAELREVVQILIDGALIRSGFEVMESNIFFERVDRALRRSLGVSETAKVEVEVAPAPPKAETAPPEMDEVATNAADFIEMQDFRASLGPELDRTFGGPKLMKMDANGPIETVPNQVAFDANDVRKRMESGEEVDIEGMVADAIKPKTEHTEL
ncbi:related to HSP82-Heat shock protein [Serendipita indica DSM 11827]|uniref:Related to HSP82-Heat shock protein n=1 Tax=Serendipita indica (strain DSM 11827) TaxID=1109443 RepID=G4TFY1_SERID|nr:related to HSP82-Heat shock protein [Serendipita indica DSM 11827]